MRTCAAYDSTVKALGFDEVRVRYRQQRRAIIREIIDKQLSGKKILAYIESSSQSLIPAVHQDMFVGDVFEDLEHIDLSRIAGMGITPDQLEKWLKLQINTDI